MKLTAEGLSRKEIAFALGVSPKTVEYYFHGGDCRNNGIIEKLHTSSIALMTQWALKQGIAEWKV